MRARQARLDPAFAEWYPTISPGEWHDAVWVREMVLAQYRKGGPRWQPEGRVLSDRHFEFQGGNPQPGSGGENRRMAPPRTSSGTTP